MSTSYADEDDELAIQPTVEPGEDAALDPPMSDADVLDAPDRTPHHDVDSRLDASNALSLGPAAPARPNSGNQESPLGQAGDVSDHIIRVIAPRRPRFAPLPYSTSRTGFVYDSAMRFHVDQTENNADAHPERPARITQIFDEFVENGLIPRPLSQEAETVYHLQRILGREATIEELCLVHTPEHVNKIRASENASIERIRELTTEGEGQASIYWHNLTWMCSKLSAGGAIEATLAVARGDVKNAVAIIRPPGHHAEPDEPGGFCFFNNVPIAARKVQEMYPNQYRKIVILDWDVHHGNGIQTAFYDDPNVLYISVHVYANASFYPNSTLANFDVCGEPHAPGKNVNIPWSDQGMKDADYMLAFQQVIMPICQEFDPDLVMISAGFDAADGDPLGACYVSPACYSHMTHMLMSLAGGKVVACLEGGYNLISIAKSALAMTRTLMGEAPERLCGDPEPTPSAVAVIHQVIRQQATYWKSLYPKKISLQASSDLISERMHDVIRDRQSKVLWENYGMVSLFVRRTGISKSFNDQVLATENYHEQRPLLVIFHDPPQVTSVSGHSMTNVVELHNTLLTDALQDYIRDAIKGEMSVMDINIPKHITKADDTPSQVTSESMQLDSNDYRSKMCRELAHYIWENYIEVGNSEHVFFMGVGEAMLGLIHLLRTEENWVTKVRGVFNFVSEQPVLAVSHPENDSISRHYYQRSTVFVADDHPFWQSNRKAKKRHGTLIRSQYDNLQQMLDFHRDRVFTRIFEETEDWREAGMQSVVDEDSGSAAAAMDLDQLRVGSATPSLYPAHAMEVMQPSG